MSVDTRMGGGRGDERIVALQLIGRPYVWRTIADNLPLLSSAWCSRVCRVWKGAVEGDGLDYGVATLCSVLARDGETEALRGRLGLELQYGTPRRKKDVWMFLKRYWHKLSGSPQSWVKLALREPEDGWLRQGAMKMRMGEYYGTCWMGWSDLHLAAVVGDRGRVRELLEGGADKDARTNNGCTPLHLAAEDGRMESVRELLACGSDIEAKEQDGRRPLHLAVSGNRFECVRELLAGGSDAEAEDGIRSGHTALYLAAFSGHVECVRELLTGGGNPEAKDSLGSTALHVAALRSKVECVGALLAGGANKDARDLSGRTPLHAAATSGHVGCVRALLEAGADREARSNDGDTPALLAMSRRNMESLMLLRGFGR